LFEKPLLNRANRFIDIRIVKFCRSRSLVKICFGSGFPVQQKIEVAVLRQMFQDILMLIAKLRAPPAPA